MTLLAWPCAATPAYHPHLLPLPKEEPQPPPLLCQKTSFYGQLAEIIFSFYDPAWTLGITLGLGQ